MSILLYIDDFAEIEKEKYGSTIENII